MAINSRRGFSVRIFLPDGDPDGLKLIEKSNWSGCGLVFPRTNFDQVSSRLELKRPGIYILIGPGEESLLPYVYVGEADPVLPRLENHIKNKDFWTHAVVFTSNTGNLNKAHIQFLESQLVALASAAKRCVLQNGNIPLPPSLTEAEKADMESFLDDVMLCLPILGYGFFEAAPAPEPASTSLVLHQKGVTASGYESPQGFVVTKGSHAVKQETNSIHSYMSQLRQSLIEQGILIDEGIHYTLNQDYAFQSPSTASGVLLGRASNGRKDWMTHDGKTLKDIQDAKASVL